MADALSPVETLRAAADALRNEALVDTDPLRLQEFSDQIAVVFDKVAWAAALDEHLIGRVGYGEALLAARVLLGVNGG